MNISEGYKKLATLVGNYFGSKGFLVNKKGDLYTRGRMDLVDTFVIRLSKTSNGQLWHHLTMDFENKKVERLFSVIEKKARLSLGLDEISKKRATCVITDWKPLYADAGLKSNNFWFTNLENIVKDDSIPEDYKSMIDIGIKWFDKISNVDNLVAHCLEAGTTHSFQNCLAASKIYSPHNLSEIYSRIVENNLEYPGWEKDEVEVFYKILTTEPVDAI